MSQFLISIFTLATISFFSFAQSVTEGDLKSINLTGSNRVQFSTESDNVNFEKTNEVEHRLIMGDLAKFNVTPVSSSYIAQNGKYVMLFVKNPAGIIKCVLFKDGKPYADDVLSISGNKINLKNGEIFNSLGFKR